MLEILSLIAIGVALYTLVAARNSHHKLGDELMRLKGEVDALKAAGIALPAETVAQVGVDAAETASAEALDADTLRQDPPAHGALEEPAPEAFDSPWAAASEAARGRVIFGGAPAGPAEAAAATDVSAASTTADAIAAADGKFRGHTCRDVGGLRICAA